MKPAASTPGAFDVSAGCTGFVYALAMAAGAVASGLHEHVLVVGAEAISRVPRLGGPLDGHAVR